jgi:DNA-binding PadR family transcriptional regulator
MKSPVNWALLGLIIERESYAFDLARRFQSIYRHVLALSSTSHIYTALTVLQERSLIEQIDGTRTGRQPKPSYRATALGIESYGDWLVSYVHEDRRRQVLFALGLSALAANAGWVSEIIDRYEQAWRTHQDDEEIFDLDGVPEGPGAQLLRRVLPAEDELTATARLTWVRHVRDALDALAPDRPA